MGIPRSFSEILLLVLFAFWDACISSHTATHTEGEKKQSHGLGLNAYQRFFTPSQRTYDINIISAKKASWKLFISYI